MQPPAHICEQLARVHPLLRIGWDGAEGSFGLLMITRSRLAKRTFFEYWRGRGPVFSRTGRPRADWDEIGRVPMYLIDVEPRDVFSGRICRMARQWMRPFAPQYLEGARQAGRDIESQIDDMGHDAGLRLYGEGQRDGTGAPIVARKFIERTPNQLNTESGRFDQTNRFVPDRIPEGWREQIAMDEGDPTDLGSI